VDAQTVINILIGACGCLIGWVLKSIRESIRDLQDTHKELTKADLSLTEKVQHIELLVAGTYVKRDDMDKLGNALFAKLDKIEAKIDLKADK
jgi:tmRNA-binding protein